MSQIVTIKLLIDINDAEFVQATLTDMMAAATQPVDEDSASSIIDWQITAQTQVCHEIDDSIANETYDEGDAFAPWLIVDTDQISDPNRCYWSNEYGWVNQDLATRFECPTEDNKSRARALSLHGHVTFFLATKSSNLSRLEILDNDEQECINAEVWSDDRLFETKFNAVQWFQQASSKDLQSLQQQGWRGCEVADEVALHFESANEDIQNLMNYVRAMQKSGSRKADIGFECAVDAEQAGQWLRTYRRPVFALMCCRENGVQISQSQDEQTQGRWDWTYNGMGSEVSFETEEEAALNALDVLANAKMIDETALI